MAYTDTFPVLGNFIETNLTSDVIASDTRLYLSDVTQFPDVVAGRDHIPCVLRSVESESREVVYVTSIDKASNSVYVTRGMEGTEARDWDEATYLYCTLTAHSAERMRINNFAPLLNTQGNRPAMTWASTKSFTLDGDYRQMIEVNSAVRIISNGAVATSADGVYPVHVTSVTYAGGKTTVAMRNISLPNSLSGIDIGILPSATPMYHPDTIVADGVTLDQEGNVMSVKVATENDRGIVNKQDVINFVRATILDAAYPVGAVYISTVATSPASLFGGSWQALGGRFLIGANSTYGAGSTGGVTDVTLTANQMPTHNHSAWTDSQGNHNHNRGNMEISGQVHAHNHASIAQAACNGAFAWDDGNGRNIDTGGWNGQGGGFNFYASRSWTGVTNTTGAHGHNVGVGNAGGGKSHTNMPPYLSVYMWKRTA